MRDLISRQAAIDALDGKIEITGRTNAEAVKGYVRLVKDRLERLPFAQPEQRWIPVTERMPEEYGEYICTLENGQVQECGFVPENQIGLVDGWSTCEADGHKFLGYVDVLAWMPLPEPYRKEGENNA